MISFNGNRLRWRLSIAPPWPSKGRLSDGQPAIPSYRGGGRLWAMREGCRPGSLRGGFRVSGAGRPRPGAVGGNPPRAGNAYRTRDPATAELTSPKLPAGREPEPPTRQP